MAEDEEKLYFGVKINLSEHIFIKILISEDLDLSKIIIEPGVRSDRDKRSGF